MTAINCDTVNSILGCKYRLSSCLYICCCMRITVFQMMLIKGAIPGAKGGVVVVKQIKG